MATSPLRRWLRRHPHPARLRVDGRDVAIATGPNFWAVTEETVLALNPSRIEAIDAQGVCTRAMVLDGSSDDAEDKSEPAGASTELTSLARIIAEAHDAGARRHAEAYTLAFTKQNELVMMLAQRLAGLETAWQKAMVQTAQAQANAMLAVSEAHAQAAEAQSTDPTDAAIGGLLMQAAAAATNGAAKPAQKGPAK